MNGFIDSLVSRFNGAENTISPRLPGKFESSYISEQGLLSDAEPAIISNSSLPAIPLHPTDLRSSPEQRLFNNKTTMDDQKQERTDQSFLSDSGQTNLRNMPVNSEEDPNSFTQKNNSVFNGQSESFQPVTNNNVFVTEIISDQKKESGSDIDRSATIILPSGIGQIIEKEKQRNEIARPVSTQIMNEQNRREEDLNYHRHDQTPVIKVSIGKIEVRAVPVISAAKIRDNSPQKPKMSLEEYLQKRNNR